MLQSLKERSTSGNTEHFQGSSVPILRNLGKGADSIDGSLHIPQKPDEVYPIYLLSNKQCVMHFQGQELIVTAQTAHLLKEDALTRTEVEVAKLSNLMRQQKNSKK